MVCVYLKAVKPEKMIVRSSTTSDQQENTQRLFVFDYVVLFPLLCDPALHILCVYSAL